MTKILKYAEALLLLVLLLSCRRELPPVLTPSPSQIDISNAQGTASVNVTCNATWSASVSVDWITISPSTGNGDGEIRITAQDNFTNSDRTSTIVLVTGTIGNTNFLRKIITINQSHSQLALDNENLTFEKGAGSKIVKVIANTTWSLQIPTEASWLTVNTKNGTTNTDLTFTVQTNIGSDRAAKVTFTFGDTTKVLNVLQNRAFNTSPVAAQLLSPSNSATDVSRLISCTWLPSTDADMDRVTYNFEISNNSGFLSGDGKTLITIATDSVPKAIVKELLKGNTKYYWRVTSSDLYSGKSVSPVYSFTTGTKGGYTDGEYRIALTNTIGIYPNELIFTGDGYTIEDYVDGGKFDQDMDAGIAAFFSVEPYKSNKSYFNVYKLAAYSQDSGVSQLDKSIVKNTAFSTVFKGETSMDTDEDKVFLYAQKIPGMEDNNSSMSGVQGKLQNTLIIIAINQDRYAGTCWSWSDGKSIALCPVSTSTKTGTNYKNVINHEAGGHGFGRLADEYISSANKGKTLPEDDKTSFQSWVTYGFYPNVDVTNDLQVIKWKHFFGKSGYILVGAYEGAYYYTLGAWRPESSSCMIFNEPYYNVPSRENMVKRILRTAAGVRVNEYVNKVYTPIPNDPYTLDYFLANDLQKSPSNAALLQTKSIDPYNFVPLAPPVLIEVK